MRAIRSARHTSRVFRLPFQCRIPRHPTPQISLRTYRPAFPAKWLLPDSRPHPYTIFRPVSLPKSGTAAVLHPTHYSVFLWAVFAPAAGTRAVPFASVPAPVPARYAGSLQSDPGHSSNGLSNIPLRSPHLLLPFLALCGPFPPVSHSAAHTAPVSLSLHWHSVPDPV